MYVQIICSDDKIGFTATSFLLTSYHLSLLPCPQTDNKTLSFSYQEMLVASKHCFIGWDCFILFSLELRKYLCRFGIPKIFNDDADDFYTRYAEIAEQENSGDQAIYNLPVNKQENVTCSYLMSQNDSVSLNRHFYHVNSSPWSIFKNFFHLKAREIIQTTHDCYLPLTKGNLGSIYVAIHFQISAVNNINHLLFEIFAVMMVHIFYVALYLT